MNEFQSKQNDFPREQEVQLLNWFVRIWAAMLIVLCMVTWRLWTLDSRFPAIPVFEALVEVPPIVDRVLFAVILLSLAAICIAGLKSERPAWWIWPLVFLAGAGASVLLNQHRLQPWMWQGMIIAVVLVAGDADRDKRLVTGMFRLLYVSIYLYSAASKMDYQFVHTVGSEMVTTLIGFAGIQADQLPEGRTVALAGFLPAFEWMMGLGLIFERTRKPAAVAGVAMHLLLIAMFLKTGQQPPVLLWNAMFVVALVCLFLHPRSGRGYPFGESLRRSTTALKVVVIGILLFPATHAVGIADQWLAWRVYAPNNSRVVLRHLPESGLGSELLPGLYVDHISDTKQFSIADWSLQEIGVPIYPEDRFQLGVFIALAEQLEIENSMVVAMQSESAQIDGRRSEVVLRGHELHSAAAQFWLGTRSRNRVVSSNEGAAD